MGRKFCSHTCVFAGCNLGYLRALFHYSETWQLVINTGTTIITFLMVFLIQKSQNKDSKAIQLKLNELVNATENASNQLVDIEDMGEEELDRMHKYYCELADRVKYARNNRSSKSVNAEE